MIEDQLYSCFVCDKKMASRLPFCASCYKVWKGDLKAPWVMFLLADQQKRARRANKDKANLSIDAWRDYEYVRIQED